MQPLASRHQLLFYQRGLVLFRGFTLWGLVLFRGFTLLECNTVGCVGNTSMSKVLCCGHVAIPAHVCVMQGLHHRTAHMCFHRTGCHMVR
jgi:hypothetical protein